MFCADLFCSINCLIQKRKEHFNKINTNNKEVLIISAAALNMEVCKFIEVEFIHLVLCEVTKLIKNCVGIRTKVNT